MNKVLLIIIFSFVLTACASRSGFTTPEAMPPNPTVSFENLYLRGVFNWWEASPSYRFNESTEGWFVDVELIADGQPYDFRLSDDKWTPSQSCGGKYKGQPVMVESMVYLICQQASENLQFTPSTTGIYRFVVSPADAGEVSLIIRRRSS